MSKYVYLAKCGKNTKIGVSDDPEGRIKQLQTGNAEKIKLVAKYESEHAEKTESMLHEFFKDCHCSGEWFQIGPRTSRYLTFLAGAMEIDDAAIYMKKNGWQAHAIFKEILFFTDHLMDEYSGIDERLMVIEEKLGVE